jgi:MFS family permease
LDDELASEQPAAAAPNVLSPLRFVLAFGVVSMLADVVYEGARSVVGPYLATLGASATVVGVVTGAGEAVALVFRLFSGRVSDRTGRHWALSIGGYLLTVAAVPVLAAVQALWQAVVLVVAERFGKAVRTPARDTMLSQAGASLGQGRAFALHEALDQSGALVGPLVVAGMVALSGYRLGFAVLAVPGVLAAATLFGLRRRAPEPAAYVHEVRTAGPAAPAPAARFPARFWLYALFTALTMAGFATFAVLAYHLQVRHVIAPALIPVTYAVAMGAAALAALASGRLYDRIGLRVLAALPALAAVVPFLSFSLRPLDIWLGALVWGLAMGVHESTMRAAVADLIPLPRRGTGYGVFTAVYGVAWLGGAAAIGALYGTSVRDLELFVVALQAAAVVAFVPLALRRTPRRA